MSNPRIHRILVPAGCLLWAGSFLAETQLLLPYAPVGLIVSPIITVMGVVFWAKHYKAVKGRYPGFSNAWKNVVSSFGKFTLSSSYLFLHLQEFWTGVILIWMLLVLTGYLTFSRSDAFAATKAYCEQDATIRQHTGGIQRYGVLVGGSISSIDAELSFGMLGKDGRFFAKALLSKQDGKWIVRDVAF